MLHFSNTQTSPTVVRAQGTLTKGDVAEVEGGHIEMESRCHREAPVRTKAGEAVALLKRIAKGSAVIRAGLDKSCCQSHPGFQINPAACAQHSTRGDRRQPKHPCGQEAADRLSGTGPQAAVLLTSEFYFSYRHFSSFFLISTLC